MNKTHLSLLHHTLLHHRRKAIRASWWLHLWSPLLDIAGMKADCKPSDTRWFYRMPLDRLEWTLHSCFIHSITVPKVSEAWLLDVVCWAYWFGSRRYIGFSSVWWAYWLDSSRYRGFSSVWWAYIGPSVYRLLVWSSPICTGSKAGLAEEHIFTPFTLFTWFIMEKHCLIQLSELLVGFIFMKETRDESHLMMWSPGSWTWCGPSTPGPGRDVVPVPRSTTRTWWNVSIQCD